jgi:hypothetical protein
MRLGVAGFFIETFKGMAERKQKGNNGDDEATATEVCLPSSLSPLLTSPSHPITRSTHSSLNLWRKPKWVTPYRTMR